MKTVFYEPPIATKPDKHPIVPLLLINFKKVNFLLLFLILTIFFTFNLLWLSNHDLYLSFKITLLWLSLPISLLIANEYFIDLPFSFFIKMHSYRIIGTDLFSNTKLQIDHHTTNEIYLDVFPQNEDYNDKHFKKLELYYTRLIKFWYAQKNYLFKVRYTFPILAMIISPFIFFCLLSLCSSSKMTSLECYITTTIFLFIFFLSITYHINSLLHSKFYMKKILDELNLIYFDHSEYRHQLKQFLDKNFLIYIHDKNYDQHFCVNTDKDFQNFISNEQFDKEGRNSIVTVFISFILIAFIEMMVNPPSIKSDINNTKPRSYSKSTQRGFYAI